jgi:hypothetical protein
MGMFLYSYYMVYIHDFKDFTLATIASVISAGWRFDAKPHVCKYAKAKVLEAF